MIEIYCDGATSNNGENNALGGFAFIIVHDGKEIYSYNEKLSSTTNNICELKAIIEGCKYAEQFINDSYIVYSDSAYCINCYKNKWYKKWQLNGWITSKKEPVKNRELWEQIIPFFENPKFNFEKVKGHSSNFFNNKADKLAVLAKSNVY